MTNRDLYLFVRDFGSKYSGPKRPSLEKYLTSLWAIAAPHGGIEPTVESLADWLDLAFMLPAPDFDPEWANYKYDVSQKGFEAWENIILSQIVDLRQMAETGQLEDEQRYFGIDAPRGSRWYNFDPVTYLECAVRGFCGGYVESEVIVLHTPAEGESADSDVFEITEFSWEDFGELLACGQFYE